VGRRREADPAAEHPPWAARSPWRTPSAFESEEFSCRIEAKTAGEESSKILDQESAEKARS